MTIIEELRAIAAITIEQDIHGMIINLLGRLEDSGALVPVATGEEIENRHVMRHSRVLFEGEVFTASNVPYQFIRLMDGQCIDPGSDAPVLPVKLVPITEAELP